MLARSEAHNLLAGCPHEACGAAVGLRQTARRKQILSAGVNRPVAWVQLRRDVNGTLRRVSIVGSVEEDRMMIRRGVRECAWGTLVTTSTEQNPNTRP